MPLLSRATLEPRLYAAPKQYGTDCPRNIRAIAATAHTSAALIGYLRVKSNGRDVRALVDSVATDCFIHKKYVTPEIPREKVTIVVHTAGKNQKIKIQHACDLSLTINGASTLGKTWLKSA